MTARRPSFGARTAGPRRRHVGLAVMIALALLWLAAASRVHVNASWSDEAWGYAAFPLFGEDPKIGDRVLFEPPSGIAGKVPYLKTERGVPGMRIAVGINRTVFLNGEAVGRAKPHALDGRPLDAIAPGVVPAGHFAAIPTTALDPPHNAASPAVPALVGSGSPSRPAVAPARRTSRPVGAGSRFCAIRRPPIPAL